MREWGLTPPQWRELSDADRDEMLAEYELVCSRCGNLRSVCSDPTRAWYPQRSMCYASGALEVTQRRLQKKHEKRSPGEDMHPLDGMSVWMAQEDLTPDDDFV